MDGTMDDMILITINRTLDYRYVLVYSYIRIHMYS